MMRGEINQGVPIFYFVSGLPENISPDNSLLGGGGVQDSVRLHFLINIFN
jgi:hypothetical protein